MRFEGDVWAVPEGRIVHAKEPIVEVTAPIAQAQLVEAVLLNQVTLHTTLTSKAARYMLAAEGRTLVDFAFRRAHGVEAARAAARGSAIVGFEATSNVEAAREFGLRVTGTMAHSFITRVRRRARRVPGVRGGPSEPDDVPRRHLRHDRPGCGTRSR